MTIDAIGTQANYGKLISVENVTISGSGQNKTLTDAVGNTIKARDLMAVLPADYTWPKNASKLTGILVYNVTSWVLMPISAEAIVVPQTNNIKVRKAEQGDEPVYNLKGIQQDGLQRGLNIVGGKKVVL